MEELLELFNECNNIYLVLSNDIAFNIVEELEMQGCKFNEDEEMTIEEVKELYESNVLLISKCNNIYYFETAYGYHRLKTIETDGIVLIEDGVIEDWEIDEYIFGDIFKVTFCEEDDDDLDEDTNEFLEDVTEELIEKLLNNNDECVHCMIKDVLRDMWETGYQDCLIDMDEC